MSELPNRLELVKLKLQSATVQNSERMKLTANVVERVGVLGNDVALGVLVRIHTLSEQAKSESADTESC